MKRIRQKTSNDCGVAAFAMMMDISYRNAMKILHPKRWFWFQDATTTLGMIRDGCTKMGYETEFSVADYDFRKIKTRAVLAVKIKEDKNHAVVWDPFWQQILDPGGRSLTVEYCAANLIGSCFLIEKAK
jgi:ABC-type bacteriocin/lantibiotic exporter with double-glycine peptidase domain